jgi:2,5-diketo-D-gluconate reductase A
MSPSTVPTVTLNDDRQIPQLGFGVFQVPPEQTQETVERAFEAGYRHIDTAQMYGNEAEVGSAVAASGIPREELWITTKLNNGFHRPDDVRRAFAESLDRLGLDQVDLFLIHWPLPKVGDYVETWRALEKIYADGRARAIGVSNFQAHHLRRLHEETTVIPAVNQIEVHPYLTQDELRAFDAEHEIATEAWSPIAQGGVLGDPVITGLARTYGKSAAQIVLRWHLQLGNIVFPKSTTRSRVQENFEIFDFELSDADMALISALNKDERTGPNPDEFNRIPGK